MPKMTRRRAQQQAQEEEEAQSKSEEQRPAHEKEKKKEEGKELGTKESPEQDKQSSESSRTENAASSKNEGQGRNGESDSTINVNGDGNEKRGGGGGEEIPNVSTEGEVGRDHKASLDRSIHGANQQNGSEEIQDGNRLVSIHHHQSQSSAREAANLNLDLQPPTHQHPQHHPHHDLLSPISAPPTTQFFHQTNHHSLQSHPDFHPSSDHHRPLQPPPLHSSNSEDDLNHHQHSSPDSFQHPSTSHQQPQTQPFFSDPFHHNAHLGTNSPEDHSAHHLQQRPTSSSSNSRDFLSPHLHHHHILGGHPHSHQMSHSNSIGYLPPPPPPPHLQGFNGGLPHYMHRASISGPIPTHGIYPPPNPSPSHHHNAPPHADQMAAWANATGGARPHTADGMFSPFGGFPGNAWGPFGAGIDYRGPTGSISGSISSPPTNQRIFSHMPGGEEDFHQHQQRPHHQHHPDRSSSIASGSGVMLGGDESRNGDSNNSLDGNQQDPNQEGQTPAKKRPRRRYDEIERLYTCGWEGCPKSYGTLNHLNAHVSMQKHGEKRSPAEFKEMRRAWRRSKREEEQRRQQAVAKANEEAIMRAKMAAHFDPNLGGGPGGPGNFSIPPGMAPPPLGSPPAAFPSHQAHPHPDGGMHHHFPHAAHPPPGPSPASMGAPYPQVYQQMNRYSFNSPPDDPNSNAENGIHNEPNYGESGSHQNEARPFTSAGTNQHPVAYLLAHRGSV